MYWHLLGEESDVSQSLFNALEELLCKLYGVENIDRDVAKYKEFCGKKTPDPNLLPSTKDGLMQHIRRANRRGT